MNFIFTPLLASQSEIKETLGGIAGTTLAKKNMFFFLIGLKLSMFQSVCACVTGYYDNESLKGRIWYYKHQRITVLKSVMKMFFF